MRLMEPVNFNKYERAKKKVERIKKFYVHLWIMISVTLLILAVRFFLLPILGVSFEDEGFRNWLDWNTFILPGLWAVVVAIHGLLVYGVSARLTRDWEQRKIKEYLDRDQKMTDKFYNDENDE